MYSFDIALGRGPRRICKVRAGPGVLDRLIEELAADPPRRLRVVVSDSNVAPLHAAPLVARMAAEDLPAELLSFSAGEKNKTRETKASLEDRLADLGADRDTELLAVGGGVTGDLAGFVAATWNRGVPVIQVPTSLLAMADAALGGKTAVNLSGVKNRVGVFHQPRGVYADTAVLSTLPATHFRDGFAEVVKAAAIADLPFFRALEETVPALLARDLDALAATVAACLRIKGSVVARDERETGRRAILNFGHTVGHAIEAASGYSVSHGRAVAIGMSVEAAVATSATGFPRSHLRRLRGLLERLGLPVRPAPDLDIDAVIEAALQDKKNRGGAIRCALPRRLGRMPAGASGTIAVERPLLRDALAAGLG